MDCDSATDKSEVELNLSSNADRDKCLCVLVIFFNLFKCSVFLAIFLFLIFSFSWVRVSCWLVCYLWNLKWMIHLPPICFNRSSSSNSLRTAELAKCNGLPFSSQSTLVIHHGGEVIYRKKNKKCWNCLLVLEKIKILITKTQIDAKKLIKFKFLEDAKHLHHSGK